MSTLWFRMHDSEGPSGEEIPSNMHCDHQSVGIKERHAPHWHPGEKKLSKKPRPKKKYKPRKISISPFVAQIGLMCQSEKQEDASFEDQIFLLQMANHTVSEKDLVLQCQVFRAANVLADRMVEAKDLKDCLFKGIEAIGAYLSPDHEEFDKERFEDLAQAVEVTRTIFNHCGTIERIQAMQAVMHEKIGDEFTRPKPSQEDFHK